MNLFGILSIVFLSLSIIPLFFFLFSEIRFLKSGKEFVSNEKMFANCVKTVQLDCLIECLFFLPGFIFLFVSCVKDEIWNQRWSFWGLFALIGLVLGLLLSFLFIHLFWNPFIRKHYQKEYEEYKKSNPESSRTYYLTTILMWDILLPVFSFFLVLGLLFCLLC
jgi:hypothetical protein